MLCIETKTLATGEVYFTAMNPQPSDVTTCSTVLQSGGEVIQNPFSPSVSDGALIAAAVISVWGAAWAFKALILTLKGSDENA
jgi:hypothetical protein